MSGWIYIAIFVGALLAVGAWTDWRRRYSSGGTGDDPVQARRSAQAGSDGHGGYLN